jgi:uncharacterized protein YggU (UPF0235/DUF167 family)
VTLVRVRAQPRARRAGVMGLRPGADGPRLVIAVTEPPEEGRANEALCATLATALGLASGRVSLAAGATSRDKTLAVAAPLAALRARLESFA